MLSLPWQLAIHVVIVGWAPLGLRLGVTAVQACRAAAIGGTHSTSTILQLLCLVPLERCQSVMSSALLTSLLP